MRYFLATVAFVLVSAFAFAGEKVTYIKGNASIFSGDATFLVVMDLSATSIDGLDTEAAFIEFNKNKKDKKDKDKEGNSEKWENDWNNDKKNFLTAFVENLSRATKNTSVKFSEDDPGSKYKMVLTPVHIETGNAIKYSSVEMKIHVYDMATNEEVAVLHVVPSRGVQMGPMSPTVGMRVNYAMLGSAQMLSGHVKKSLKPKKK